MKLAYCTKCSDVFKITYKLRRCQCKQSYAYAVDDLKNKCETGYVSENVLPIAMDNNYLMLAKLQWDRRDKRTSFIHAWTIDVNNPINDCKIIIKKAQKGNSIFAEQQELLDKARAADKVIEKEVLKEALYNAYTNNRANSNTGRSKGRIKPKVLGNHRAHAN